MKHIYSYLFLPIFYLGCVIRKKILIDLILNQVELENNVFNTY